MDSPSEPDAVGSSGPGTPRRDSRVGRTLPLLLILALILQAWPPEVLAAARSLGGPAGGAGEEAAHPQGGSTPQGPVRLPILPIGGTPAAFPANGAPVPADSPAASPSPAANGTPDAGLVEPGHPDGARFEAPRGSAAPQGANNSPDPRDPGFADKVWHEAQAAGFARPTDGPDAAPADGVAAPAAASAAAALSGGSSGGRVLTMAELLRRKTIPEIRKEIFEISLSHGWAQWLYEIAGYLDDEDEQNVLLVTDSNDKILGFLLLGHGYNSDDKRTIVYEGDIYIAYMAVRRGPEIKGVGKKLFLEASRQAKLEGEDELVLHVKKGEDAYGFYQAMSKYAPIKSENIDTTYVAGETWIMMTFDLTKFAVEKSVAPAPPAPAAPAAPAKSFFSWTTGGFLGSLLASELWIEATAFAIPMLAAAVSGGFAGMALIGGLATAALALGNLLGGPVVKRFGVRKTYGAMFLLRVALAVGFNVWYRSSPSSIVWLGLLAGLEYFAIGISRVAETTFAAAQYGSSIPLLNRFGTWQSRVVALVGILGAAAVTGAITSLGLGAMLAIFSVVLAAGAFTALSLVRPPSQANGFQINGIPEAWRALRQDPLLKNAAWGYGVPAALIFFLYLLVFPAFGMYVARGQEQVAQVMACLAGLLSAGEFIGAWVSDAATKRAERRLALLTEVPATQRAAALRRVFLQHTRRWLAAAGLSLLGLWALAAGGPLAYAAMALLGFAAAGALVQSESLLRSAAPESGQATFLGLVRTVVMAATALGFIPLALVFHPFSTMAAGALAPTRWAFVALGLLATVGAALFLRVARGLRSGPHAAPAAPLPVLPALAQVGTDRMTTMRDLAKDRPLEQIKEEIRALSVHAGFGPRQDVVDSYLSSDPSRILLVTDESKNILGFLMLDNRITTDFGGRTLLPGFNYIAYLAARPDTQGRGIGKKLVLEAARLAKLRADELILHVDADSGAVNFYRALGKYLPIKSETMDRRYVAGHRWLKFIFDVRGVR